VGVKVGKVEEVLEVITAVSQKVKVVISQVVEKSNKRLLQVVMGSRIKLKVEALDVLTNT
jgi:hypothetical protein